MRRVKARPKDRCEGREVAGSVYLCRAAAYPSHDLTRDSECYLSGSVDMTKLETVIDCVLLACSIDW